MLNNNGNNSDDNVASILEGLDADSSTENSISALQQELSKTTEKYLRALAEVENVKKRSEQSILNVSKFAVNDFAKELLPVLDVFEKAVDIIDINTVDNNVKAVIIGIEMTQKELLKVLAKFGITKINALNQPFNSNMHEALSIVQDASVANDTVTTVVEDGYVMHDRLLRAAKVIISRN